MEKALKKAIEGGYPSGMNLEKSRAEMMLDPNFWQSLGKALGWKDTIKSKWEECSKCGGQPVIENPYQNWNYQWHYFIDHLVEGKSADSFFEELLSISI